MYVHNNSTDLVKTKDESVKKAREKEEKDWNIKVHKYE